MYLLLPLRAGDTLPDQVPGLRVRVPDSLPIVSGGSDVPGLAQGTEGLGPSDTKLPTSITLN